MWIDLLEGVSGMLVADPAAAVTTSLPSSTSGTLVPLQRMLRCHNHPPVQQPHRHQVPFQERLNTHTSVQYVPGTRPPTHTYSLESNRTDCLLLLTYCGSCLVFYASTSTSKQYRSNSRNCNSVTRETSTLPHGI